MFAEGAFIYPCPLAPRGCALCAARRRSMCGAASLYVGARKGALLSQRLRGHCMRLEVRGKIFAQGDCGSPLRPLRAPPR